ncbi:2-succinyl-6-hydroxy-2, 4-cyclohexadiene-1-carboxylate synthase, partial [Haemophilus influenzae]
KLLDLS